MQTKIEEMKQRIAVLEWDKRKNQINPGKLALLDKYKGQLADLVKQSEE